MNKLLKIPSNYISKLPQTNVLELDSCWVIESTIQCESRAGRMFLEDHLLLFVLEGTQTLTYGKQKYQVSKNEMILLKKSSVVEFEKQGNPDKDHINDSLMFCLCDNFIKEFIANTKSKPLLQEIESQNIVSSMNDKLIAFAYSLKPYFYNTTAVNPELLRLKITELLYNVTESSKHIFHQLCTVNQFIRKDIQIVLEQNVTSPLTLPELAQLSGRSLSSFKRDFKTIYNMSPAQWIRERRLDKAKQMLVNTTLPIADICYLSGFENSSHFSRLFKEHYQHSPSYYRN